MISLHFIIRPRPGETAKKLNTKFKIKMSQLINRPDVSSRSCESQARSSSRRFTGKPEQSITTKFHAKKDDGSEMWHPSWHPRILRGAMHSGKKWRSALWLTAMHSGKKWWIGEFEPHSIYSFYVSCSWHLNATCIWFIWMLLWLSSVCWARTLDTPKWDVLATDVAVYFDSKLRKLKLQTYQSICPAKVREKPSKPATRNEWEGSPTRSQSNNQDEGVWEASARLAKKTAGKTYAKTGQMLNKIA